jgi:predicted AlkP superfamily phosphohydrolase/phosphomutase
MTEVGDSMSPESTYPLRASRVAVIGLDCASPVLLFDRWLDELPTLRSLCRNGLYGGLTSIIPPITVPAWACMLSGKDPGELGIYGFRNRKDHAYDDLYVVNSLHVREKRVWDYLGDVELRSILLGVPLTYPARPMNGLMVSGFPAPEPNADFTYPRWLRAKLDRWAGGTYQIDVKGFRTDDKAWLLDQIRFMTRSRFRLAERLVEEDWDFFMMVEMGVDRLYHGLWRYCDPDHYLYEPGNPYETAVLDYHKQLDDHMGRLLAKLPTDTLVLVVSDHGARAMHGGFAVNEWLRAEGLLTLKDRNYTGRLKPDAIDWNGTSVWGEGGYYARLFFNVKGREPQGVVPAADYDSFRRGLKDKIEALTDPAGRPMGNQVFLPEELYVQTNGVPPDLMVLLGGLDYRSVGSLGYPDPFTVENDTGPDDANHDMEGLVAAAFPDRPLPRAGTRLDRSARIYDIAPTILRALGVTPPDHMGGKALDLVC